MLHFFLPLVSIVTGFKYLVDAVVMTRRAAEDGIGYTPTCSTVYYIEMDGIQPGRSNPWHVSWRYLSRVSILKICESANKFTGPREGPSVSVKEKQSQRPIAHPKHRYSASLQI
jgi:hypothetical protein